MRSASVSDNAFLLRSSSPAKEVKKCEELREKAPRAPPGPSISVPCRPGSCVPSCFSDDGESVGAGLGGFESNRRAASCS